MDNQVERVYLNGKMVIASEASISVFDYNFLFGYGLFETMHAYNGVIFRLKNHIDRLMNSAIKLKISIDPDSLIKAVSTVLEANRLSEARVRLVVTPGTGKLVPDISSCRQPIILAIATRHIPHSIEIYNKGYRVIIASNCRNTHSAVAGIKVTGYLENILARQEARSRGADDAILFNEEGNLAEASMSNVFMVKNNVLFTPPLSAGILPGITRDVVLELAPACGIKTIVKDIHLPQLMEADEIFLTASMLEIMPVTVIEDRQIGSGKPGTVTRELTRAYKELVQKETAGEG